MQATLTHTHTQTDRHSQDKRLWSHAWADWGLGYPYTQTDRQTDTQIDTVRIRGCGHMHGLTGGKATLTQTDRQTDTVRIRGCGHMHGSSKGAMLPLHTDKHTDTHREIVRIGEEAPITYMGAILPYTHTHTHTHTHSQDRRSEEVVVICMASSEG